jgi:Spy/CpxP family protein refolding chaperone
MFRTVLILVTALAAPASAQTPPGPPLSPYAGQEQRAIKALSSEEIGDLLEGRGMGFAKAAELNGYPGPAHVLELAAPLGLDAQQEAATRELHGRMLAEARRLGAAIVEAEGALDQAFAARRIDAAGLRQRLTALATLHGQLRAVHLEAHLAQTRLLTPEQVARYTALRGYGATAPSVGHGRHGH